MKLKMLFLLLLTVPAAVRAAELTLEADRLIRIAWKVNYCDETRRLGGDATFDNGPQRLYLHFDFSAVPENFQLQKAELVIQSHNPVIDDGVINVEFYPLERWIERVNKDALLMPGVLPEKPACSADWRFDWNVPGRFELTGLIRDYLSGARINFGLLLASRGDLSETPDKDMYHFTTLQLVLSGTDGEATKLTPTVEAMEKPEDGWRFPDGSVIAFDQLPGKLISSNKGFWGKFQIAGGMTARLTDDIYLKDTTTGRNSSIFLDGKFDDGAILRGGGKEPVLVMEFPGPATVTELDVALKSLSGHFELALVAGDTPETMREVARFRQNSAKKQFFRFAVEGVKARCFGLINTGGAAVELSELLLWGDAAELPVTETTGVLPEMAKLARRELTLQWFDKTPGQKEMLEAKQLDFYPLNSSDPDPDTHARLAMSPAGLEVLFACRESAGSSRDYVEIYLNRYDLNERHYYVFKLDKSGKLETDASAVIDPTKGDIPFKPEGRVNIENGVWYGHIRIPLAAMAGKEGFEAHQWPVNLVRRTGTGDAEKISSYPAVPELHIPMLFTLLRSERQLIAGSDYISFTGIQETVFSRKQFETWRRQLGHHARNEVVVAPADFTAEIINAPVLPVKDLNQPRRERLAASETENLAWYVINPSTDKTITVPVEFSGFDTDKNITAELGVVGVVQRRRGAMLRPIFLAGNLPGAPALRQYVRNAPEIEKFPELTLPPGHAALVTLRVRTENTASGNYSGRVAFGKVEIPLNVEVLAVTPKRPGDYYYAVWAQPTRPAAGIFGHKYAEWEARYWRDSGYNVVHSYPIDSTEGVQALEKTIPDLKYIFIPSSKYAHLGFCELLPGAEYTDAHRQEVIETIRDCRDRLQAAGFGYDRWVVEMWDEPGTGVGTTLMAKLAQTIKEFDKNILIYANPCCWGGNGFAPDQKILDAFLSWYPKYIDVSLPIAGLYFGFPGRDMKALREIWDQPYKYKGTYIHPCPGRMQLWEHFKANLNAWGYYSYYAPRLDAWNDLDFIEMDYCTVYPGTTAPVITIQSEQMREGFEDICLLNALRSQGKGRQAEKIASEFDPAKTSWSKCRDRILDSFK